MISFIMPAKNESSFIKVSIDSLISAEFTDWELIVVDDHSVDNTFSIVQLMTDTDKRIKIFHNPGYGKIEALNYGYQHSEGDLIKCIDADDILLDSYFIHSELMDYEASCHDASVVDRSLKKIASYTVNKNILSNNFEETLIQLASIPRWSWSFKRELGDKIFPLPEELPFEDVWFTVVIKKYAKNIKYIPQKLYLYRQNSNQTYGGIFNFSDEIIMFRANRTMKLIKVLEEVSSERFNFHIDKNYFSVLKKYLNILCSEYTSILDIIKCRMSLKLKVKAVILKKAKFVAPFALKLKWFVDRLFR